MEAVKLTNDERNDHQNFLISHLSEVNERFQKSFGLALYNTAEFLLTNGKLRIAFHYFRMAAHHDAYYNKTSYVWSQAAGILFRLKRYGAAALGYARAMRREKVRKPETMALFADAQLHRGRIGSAAFWLKRALQKDGFQNDPRFGTFEIQLLSAEKIIEIFKTPRISINTLRANELYEKARQSSPEEAAAAAFESAFLNPADPQPWSMLAKLATARKDLHLAQEFAMIGASLSDSNASYWMDLVVYSIFTKSEISGLILVSSFMSMANLLAAEAYDRSKITTDEKLKSFFRDLGQSLSQLPHRQAPRLIRIRDMDTHQILKNFQIS